MINKAEQLLKNSDKAKEISRATEPPPLPQEALVKAHEAVSELKDSGRPLLHRIAAAKGVPLEAQEVIEAEAELVPLEDEADEAVEILDSDILEAGEADFDLAEGDYEIVKDIDLPPTKTPPVPPPMPKEAKRSKTIESMPAVKEPVETVAEAQRRSKQEYADSIWGKLMAIYELAKQEREDEEIKLADIKLALIDVMHEMYQFSFKFVKPIGAPEDEDAERMLNVRLKVLTKMKTKVESKVSGAFEEIFREFGDIIDEHLVTEYIEKRKQKGQSVSVEEATRAVYHRTPEEMEVIKENNRQAAAELVLKLSGKESLTIEDIEQLHGTNNRGIVPRGASKIRSKTGVNVSFLKRFGTLAQHVEEAMADLVQRTNQLLEAESQGMSTLRYGIEAAKLHNDLLDIHPFADRNGSTSLLFLETLMARRGYVPDIKRQKSYYKNLHTILGGNMIALGIVGYQQVVIAKKFGYYKLPAISGNKKMKDQYDDITKAQRAVIERESREYKLAVATAKKQVRSEGVQKVVGSVKNRIGGAWMDKSSAIDQPKEEKRAA